MEVPVVHLPVTPECRPVELKKGDSATRSQHAGHLLKGAAKVRYIPASKSHRHRLEGAIAIRKPHRIALVEVDTTLTFSTEFLFSEEQHLASQVEPDDLALDADTPC